MRNRSPDESGAEEKAEDEGEEPKEKGEVAAEVEGAVLHRGLSTTCGGTASGQVPHLRHRTLQRNCTSPPLKRARNGRLAKARVTARARKGKGNRREALAKEKAKECVTSGKNQEHAHAPTANSPTPVDTLPRLAQARSRAGSNRPYLLDPQSWTPS